MFTGIVQGRGQVTRVTDRDGVRALWVRLPPGRADGLVPGASVAIAGVCLTAVAVEGEVAQFDCIDETLRRTTLARLTAGDEVNVERAARFGDEVGGHFLSGHIFTTGAITERTEEEGNLTLAVRTDPDSIRFVMPKGYIAIDGVSLTVGTVSNVSFRLHLIPETRRLTTLDHLRPGDTVNVELDAMTQAVVETVERVLALRRGHDG